MDTVAKSPYSLRRIGVDGAGLPDFETKTLASESSKCRGRRTPDGTFHADRPENQAVRMEVHTAARMAIDVL
jgi:hypothetical protein